MFDRLLSRFGYIKLDSYGLEIGRDGRVRTTHRDLHDDGSGIPIVGWETDDEDVAALPAWKALPALAAPPEEDEWDMVITRARVRVAEMSDLDEEAPTMHDISLPPKSPPPPPPPIPHVPRTITK